MRQIFANCRINDTEHPKARAFNTVRDARDFVRSHDPADLHFVVITIHLAKDDLSDARWSQLLDEVLVTDVGRITEKRRDDIQAL